MENTQVTATPTPAAAVNDAPVDGVSVEQAATEETTSVEGEAAQAPAIDDNVQFPKKAINAISRRDKQIGKLRAEREQLMRELDGLRQKPQEIRHQAEKEPNIGEFDSYDAYTRALTRWEIKQAEQQRNLQTQEAAKANETSAQEQQWVDQRTEHISNQVQEIIKTVPDMVQVLQEYSDVIEGFSPEVERMFLALDNAPMAVYNLAKEGKLEQLAAMPLQLAAVEIYQAQHKQAPVAKKVTQAPKPITASKGSGAGLKNLGELSPDDLVKRLLS